MKTAGIRELKAHLSSYVREVERGGVVLVTDRGRVVAELRPPGEEAKASVGDLWRRQLVEEGRLRPARTGRTVRFTELPEIRLPPGMTIEGIIDAERGE